MRAGANSQTFGSGVDRGLKLLAVILVFFGATEFLGLSFSLAGLGLSRPAAITVLLAALLATGVYSRFLAPFRRSAPAEFPERPVPGRGLKALGWAAGAVYLLLWYLAYVLPDFSYDGLWYHIPTLHFWARAGEVHWITADPTAFWDPLINNCFNGFPKGVALFTFVLIRATGLARLLNSANLPFLPLGILAIFCLARFLGARVRFALPAALLFLMVPVNIAQSPTSLVDTAAASRYIALFAILAFCLEAIGENRIPWELLPALGAALGLAIAAKTPGLILLPLSVVLLAAGAISARRTSAGEGGSAPGLRSARKGGFSPAAAFGFILLTVLLAGAVGGYWPLRNYRRTANPINPVGLTVAGKTIFPDYAFEEQFHAPYAPGTENWTQAARILYNWLEGPRDGKLSPVTYHSLRGGLGLLWLLGCLPALFYLAAVVFRKRLAGELSAAARHRAKIFFGFGLLATALFFAMPPDHNHIARYTIWLYGLGLPGLALAAQRLWSAGSAPLRRGARAWILVVAALLLLEGLFTLRYNLELVYLRRDRGEVAEGLLACLLRGFRDDYPIGYPDGSLMDILLRRNDPVALGTLPDRKRLLLGRLVEDSAFGRRRVFFLEPRLAANREELRRFLAERGIRFVVWDSQAEVPAPLGELTLLEEFAAGDFRLMVCNPALSGGGAER